MPYVDADSSRYLRQGTLELFADSPQGSNHFIARFFNHLATLPQSTICVKRNIYFQKGVDMDLRVAQYYAYRISNPDLLDGSSKH